MENYWKNKNVLITGGTGYLGLEIASKLIELSGKVICFSKDNPKEKSLFYTNKMQDKIKIILGNILDLELVKKTIQENNIEVVFHLAGQPIANIGLEKPLETIQTNVMGTTTLLEACRLTSSVKSILVASSIHAYNPNKPMPFREDDELKGKYPYEASKSCLDIISQCYGKTYDLNIGITRFSNIYGGGDLEFNRLVSKTIKDIIENNKITLVHEGKPIREFIYIKDAVRANLSLAENIDRLKLKGEAFNFGLEKTYKVIEIVNMLIEIGKQFGFDAPEVKLSKQEVKDVRDLYPCSEKAKQLIGWNPEYSLREGLLETFKWYMDYFNLEASKK
ncbi:MAG: NAD-dependent epimerase/dehydratase family protein [archaeon]|nr:NAD-dependent epimerase/dehydratase family protein [archaeon]